MAVRNDSGAEKNSGKSLIRCRRSKGISGMLEAASGEGRAGRDGSNSLYIELGLGSRRFPPFLGPEP